MTKKSRNRLGTVTKIAWWSVLMHDLNPLGCSRQPLSMGDVFGFGFGFGFREPSLLFQQVLILLILCMSACIFYRKYGGDRDKR
jgi:hypothetical protein